MYSAIILVKEGMVMAHYIKKIFVDDDYGEAFDEAWERMLSSRLPAVVICGDRVCGINGFTRKMWTAISQEKGLDVDNMFWDPYEMEVADAYNSVKAKKALKADLALGLTVDDIECNWLDKMCGYVQDHVEEGEMAVACIGNKVLDVWNVKPEFFSDCISV